MRILRKIRKEVITYIPKGGVGPEGVFVHNFAASSEILVRWEDDQIEYLNPEGETEQSRSVVYFGKDDIPEKGAYLYKGLKTDFDALTEAEKIDAIKKNEIRGVKVVPTLRYTDYLVMGFLGPFN